MNEVLRIEQKYLLSCADQKRYSHRFECLLVEDNHSSRDGYLIRSLYFDTPGNQDYWDKENGVELRKKLRLRCYSPNAEFALLEMKQKQGTSQRKRSLQLTRQQAQSLCQGDYSPLLAQPDPFALECYTLMLSELYRPKVMVEYRRRAFVAQENRTRVTFDTGITSCEGFNDLFDPLAPLSPALDPSLSVMEVKYNGFLLSYIQQIVNEANKSTLSISKYCLGRTLLL